MLRGTQKTKKELIASQPKKNMPKIHIILDIDYTLANGYHKKNIQEVLECYPHLQSLADKNLFINAAFPHCLHPGVIEFIQWLFQLSNIKVSFFSGGGEIRNTAFVHELLTRALGDHFDKMKDTVSIYSRQHLVPSKQEDTRHQTKLFKMYDVIMKKDLKKILQAENLDNTILIDDDPICIYPGQEKNVLIAPSTNDYPFYEFHTYSQKYPDELGEKILLMNHLFYIAGLLSKIIAMKNNCLAANLFSLQYKPTGDGTYERNEDLYTEHQYYLDGLSELRKVNPALEFYGGDLANEYFKKSSFMLSP